MGDRYKTSRLEGCSLAFLDGLAYNPEPLGAGARQYEKWKRLGDGARHRKKAPF